jgi:hypothetical protein
MIRNILLAKDKFYFNNRLKSSFIEFQLEMSNYVMCNNDFVKVNFYKYDYDNENNKIKTFVSSGKANYNADTGYY